MKTLRMITFIVLLLAVVTSVIYLLTGLFVAAILWFLIAFVCFLILMFTFPDGTDKRVNYGL